MNKILILDDEPLMLQYLYEVLTKYGFSILCITKPQMFFTVLINEKIDLILLDMNLPEIDGLQILEQLKANSVYSTIPVIILTADNNPAVLAQCFEKGANDFILKPIHEKSLKARVDSALAIRSYAAELETQVKLRTEQLQDAFAELERVTHTFQLFVPRPFIQRIFSSSFTVGELLEETFSILFLDIRSYTSLSESMKSSEVFHFLNRFFNVMEPCILENNGFVDKFVGDSLMALFEGEDSAVNAVKAAIEMQQQVSVYNLTRGHDTRPLIKIGIGINTGPVIVGAVGSSKRLNSTVIGDHVNLAARLEQLTKAYDAQILISHHTCHLLQEDSYYLREIDTLRVKGKNDPVTIYEVFDCEQLLHKQGKLCTKSLLFAGIALYKSQMFEDALEKFYQCLQIFPQDGVPFKYIKRCKYFQKYPPLNPEWDGTIDANEPLLDQNTRRRASRYSLEIDVDIFYAYKRENEKSLQKGETAILGIAKDMSLSGMRIFTSESMNTGDIFVMETQFEGSQLEKDFSQGVCKLLCQVIWKTYDLTPDRKLSWEIGLEILILDYNQEKILEQGLRKLVKSQN